MNRGKTVPKNSKARKKYQKPQLKKYPPLKKLTAGSIGITEI